MYNGQTYEFNKNMTSILCMGIDKSSFDGASDIKGENGQADVLILVAMEPAPQQQSVLDISRDTMTDVAVYSASGYYVGNCKRTDLPFICLR